MSNAAEPSGLHREVVRAEFMTCMLAIDHATDAGLDHLDPGADYRRRPGHSNVVVEAHIVFAGAPRRRRNAHHLATAGGRRQAPAPVLPHGCRPRCRPRCRQWRRGHRVKGGHQRDVMDAYNRARLKVRREEHG